MVGPSVRPKLCRGQFEYTREPGGSPRPRPRCGLGFISGRKSPLKSRPGERPAEWAGLAGEGGKNKEKASAANMAKLVRTACRSARKVRSGEGRGRVEVAARFQAQWTHPMGRARPTETNERTNERPTAAFSLGARADNNNMLTFFLLFSLAPTRRWRRRTATAFKFGV